MTEQFDLKDPDPIKIELDCLRSRQPIGDLYFANVTYKDIMRITYFDVRRVMQEERDIERYLGIQRPLSNSRVKDLYDYVNFYDATFPTAIIIAVDEEFATFNEDTKTITLSNVARGDELPSIAIHNIARVLDGQHRIAGLKNFDEDHFDVPVTIFVGASIADQAHVFATVNLEQQKVNKSLTYDLYSLSKSRSPQKTCHNVAVVLDRDKEGPLYSRIKRLGIATDGRTFEPLSQATFVEALMKYVSKDPKSDRDALLRGNSLDEIPAAEVYNLPFRNLFIREKDIQIVKVVHDYYSAIKNRWPKAWDSTDRGNMLNRTNGFRAFMRAFKHIHKLHGTPSGIVPREFFDAFLNEVELEDKDFSTERFLPGTSGESDLVKLLEAVEL